MQFNLLLLLCMLLIHVQFENKIVDAKPALEREDDPISGISSSTPSPVTPAPSSTRAPFRPVRRFVQSILNRRGRQSDNNNNNNRSDQPEVEVMNPSTPSKPGNGGGGNPRNPLWNFIQSLLETLRGGNAQQMISQLVEQIQNFVYGVSSFFNGSNDAGLGVLDREMPSLTGVYENRIRPDKVERNGKLVQDDILKLFNTNASTLDESLQKRVKELENSLNTFWDQVQDSFPKTVNVTDVIKRFDVDETSPNHPKRVAHDIHSRLNQMWKKFSLEVMKGYENLSNHVHGKKQSPPTILGNDTSSSTESNRSPVDSESIITDKIDNLDQQP